MPSASSSILTQEASGFGKESIYQNDLPKRRLLRYTVDSLPEEDVFGNPPDFVRDGCDVLNIPPDCKVFAMPPLNFTRLLLGTLTGLIATSWIELGNVSWAAIPTNPELRQQIIGQPQRIEIVPPAVELKGSRASRQVLVIGHYSDGSTRDLTAFADWRVEGSEVARCESGWLVPRQNGEALLHIQVGGQSAQIRLRVSEAEKIQPVSFRHEVIAALNVGGCNQGACHGTPSGKNGFRLSLRGFDPTADYAQLTRDVFGRRTDRLNPEASLIWLKGLGRIPHEGGARLSAESVPAQTLLTWLREGLHDDPPSLPSVTKIDVLPGNGLMRAPARWQQLAVLAHFSDGRVVDVTRLTVFTSSDPGIADVNPNGLVEFKQSGEAAILCRYLEEMVAVRLTYLEEKKGFAWPNPPEYNEVDRFVFAKLKILSIAPSDLCTDSEFLRRSTLDLCGRLPRLDETKAFLADPDANKRVKWIDYLLQQPEYADFWTLKWSDVLRASRKTMQLKGVHTFHQWLRDHISRNTPFDQVTREILTAKGPSHANPAANFFRVARDASSLAETAAQLFLGVRMQCAKCHNHPFERWTQDDYYSTAAFFVRVKHTNDARLPSTKPNEILSEVIYTDRQGEITQPRTGKTMPPRFPGGETPQIAPNQDRREVLADWLTRPDNPFFAKSVVNRIWFHLMGRGIVDPVDDFRESNPSANDELLDALAREFVKSGFDVKHLIRKIMTSRTYQLSSEPTLTNKDDQRYFSRAVTKLLTAEQLLDALCDVTGVPEKFPSLPLGTRAIQLPDGEVNHPFLKAFGQPARELACECERESDSNLGQALQLINGPTINDKIRKPDNRLGQLLAANKSPAEVLDELYLAALCRTATAPEAQAALSHVEKAEDKRKAWEDVLWAILNTREFLFRH